MYGFSWLVGACGRAMLGRGSAGDKVLRYYRGIENLRLHVYTAGEVRRVLRRAGLKPVEVIGLTAERDAELPRRTFLWSVRSNGFIAVAKKA